jgi:uncharacterized protein (DUF488 family)
MPILYTIGYGNRQPSEFFAMIPEGTTIIDVRRRANGWNRAYEETALRERFGVAYLHWPALGNSYRGTKDEWIPEGGWGNACDFLDAAASLLTCKPCTDIILMCAESDPMKCHRRFVAEEIAARVPGLEIVHL